MQFPPELLLDMAELMLGGTIGEKRGVDSSVDSTTEAPDDCAEDEAEPA